MGQYDLPATINFITNLTKVSKISFVGHSQGTSQLFSALSTNITYYNSKINGFVALGPVTNIKYTSSFLLSLTIKFHTENVAKLLGINEILRGPEDSDSIIGYLCKYFTSLCKGVLSLIADSHPDDDDMNKFVDYMGHFPSGTSLKALIHYAQIFRRGEFVNFDYGYDENFRRYGQPTAPVYELNKIQNIPVCMLYGDDDTLSNEKDNRFLKEILEKNNVMYIFRQYENVGHLTYFLPKDTRSLNDTLNCISFFNK